MNRINEHSLVPVRAYIGNSTMNKDKLLSPLFICSISMVSIVSSALAQTTYMWNGTGEGGSGTTWSITTNWSPNSGFPGSLDTANIDTTTGVTINYDTGASGTIGTLNMIETNVNVTTILQLNQGLTISTGGTLENTATANSSGYQEINLNGNSLNIASNSRPNLWFINLRRGRRYFLHQWSGEYQRLRRIELRVQCQ